MLNLSIKHTKKHSYKAEDNRHCMNMSSYECSSSVNGGNGSLDVIMIGRIVKQAVTHTYIEFLHFSK